MSRAADAVAALAERTGSDGPVTVASAPGRVNLVGGHTDYNEGLVLPTAVDRRTVVAARPRTDDRLVVTSLDFGETATLSATAPDVREGHWSAYVAGVAAAFADDGHVIDGADLVVDGGVPMGAGLSSSAALEVAVAGALDAVGDVGLADERLATLCWRAETEHVGVDCGIMDQYVATLAAADSALFLDCRTREHERVPLDPDAVRPVVVDTTVQHDLVDSAYNDRVATCRAAVDALAAAAGDDIGSLRDADPETLDAHAGALDRTQRRRCRHVVTENRRVREAVDALRAGAHHEVGRLLTRSHESLRDDYEVSCAELDAVVERATATEGVYGARMTGAGFGGCVVALVAAGAADEVAATLPAACAEAIDATPTAFACRPASGLRVRTRD